MPHQGVEYALKPSLMLAAPEFLLQDEVALQAVDHSYLLVLEDVLDDALEDGNVVLAEADRALEVVSIAGLLVNVELLVALVGPPELTLS